MDITIQIILEPATHTLTDASKNARRYKAGDPVDVRNLAAPNTWGTRVADTVTCNFDATQGKFGYIHIIDIPDQIDFELIKGKLLDGIRDQVDTEIVYRRRQFRLPIENLPDIPIVQNFLANKEGTFTWTAAKNYIKKKVVVNNTDASLDDEATSLTDTDITG